MWITLLHWLHFFLVSSALLFFSIGRAVVGLFYAAFPFKPALDALYTRSTVLRRHFAYRLGALGGEDRRLVKAHLCATTEELIVECGYGVQLHAITIPSGFVLALHRVVAGPATIEAGAGATPGSTAAADTAEQDADAARLRALSDELNLERPLPHVKPQSPQQRPQQPHHRHHHSSSRSKQGTTAAAAAAHLPRRMQSAFPVPAASPREGATNAGKPPVLFLHGLMMSSESFVCAGSEGSLPFLLADAGYDVWMTNNRGNRYSSKHMRLHPSQPAYWDFSLDDLIMDAPLMIDYVLATTGYSKLALVCFSQGTTQAFASLARYPSLNDKVSVFVALSPAMAIRGLSKSPVTTLVQTDVTFLYLLFGRKKMLGLAYDVQRMLSASAWVRVLDFSLSYLFGWTSSQIDPTQKLIAFSHLYSPSSVKVVVHWFSIISAGKFTAFNDASRPSSLLPVRTRFPLPGITAPLEDTHERVMPLYDTSKITVPLGIFVGGSDTLIDVDKLLTLLPPLSGAVCMPAAEADLALQQPVPGAPLCTLQVRRNITSRNTGGAAAEEAPIRHATSLRPLASHARAYTAHADLSLLAPPAQSAGASADAGAAAAVTAADTPSTTGDTARVPSVTLVKVHTSRAGSRTFAAALARSTWSRRRLLQLGAELSPLLAPARKPSTHRTAAAAPAEAQPSPLHPALPPPALHLHPTTSSERQQQRQQQHHHQHLSHHPRHRMTSTLPDIALSLIAALVRGDEGAAASAARAVKEVRAAYTGVPAPLSPPPHHPPVAAAATTAADASSSSSEEDNAKELTGRRYSSAERWQRLAEAVARGDVTEAEMQVQTQQRVPQREAPPRHQRVQAVKQAGGACPTALHPMPSTGTGSASPSPLGSVVEHATPSEQPPAVQPPAVQPPAVQPPAVQPRPQPQRQPQAQAGSGQQGNVWMRYPPVIFCEPSYEHLDFLWARTAPQRAFPAVLALLDRFKHTQVYTGAGAAGAPPASSPGVDAAVEQQRQQGRGGVGGRLPGL